MPKDTLYDDITGEMEDYELALFEGASGDMVLAMATSDIQEDGQSLAGIWSLFGIEAYLSAAGLPSEDENLNNLKRWGKENPAQLTQEIAEKLSTKVREIAAFRIADDADAEVVNSARDRMLERLNKAPETSSSFPPLIKENPVTSNSDPQKVEPPKPISPAIAPMVTNQDEPPEWWSQLLLKARDICEKCHRNEDLAKHLEGRPNGAWQASGGYSRFWDQLPYRQPLDPDMVDWLSKQAEHTSLLNYVIQPDLLVEFPIPESRIEHIPYFGTYFLCEARRVMWAALLQHPPTGLRAYLPSEDHSGVGIFEGGIENNAKGELGRALVKYLMASWSGISEPRGSREPFHTHPSFPAELWAEVKESTLLRELGSSVDYSGNKFLLVSFAWCAWRAGEWNQETYQKIYSAKVTNEYSRLPLKAESFKCSDPAGGEFVKDFNTYINKQLDLHTGSANLDQMLAMRFHKGTISVSKMLTIAENLTPKYKASDFSNLLRVSDLPSKIEIQEIKNRLVKVPEITLKKILPYTGFAMPHVLDAINDDAFCELAKKIMGTFAEPLIEEPCPYHRRHFPEVQQWYPGRQPCGVTNLNPFYDAISSCTKKLYQEIIRYLGDSNIIEDGKTRLKLMAGMALGKRDNYSGFQCYPEVVQLTHRLPKSRVKQEKEKRLQILGEMLLSGDQTTRNFIQRYSIWGIRDAAKFYAEAAGINDWRDAAYEMADLLKVEKPIEKNGYTLMQTPHEANGLVVYKGKRKLKKTPPAIAKDEDLVPLFGKCQAIHLIGLSLIRDIQDHYIETGELPSEELAAKYQILLGVDPLQIMQDRLALKYSKEDAQLLADALSATLQKCCSENSSCRLSRQDLPSVNNTSPINLNILQEQGWPCDYWWRASNYQLEKKFPAYGLRLEYEAVGSTKAKSGGLPTAPVPLELYYIAIKENTPLSPDDIRLKRIASSIMQDIAISASES